MRPYTILDVFTDTPLAGNPLALVEDAAGLTDDQLQRLAREFNLSETIFLLPPDTPRHRARVRIFTPEYEMAFAGHPIIGACVHLALGNGGGAEAFGLETNAGVVSCVAEKTADRVGRARLRAPKPPTLMGPPPAADAVAAALNLDPAEIGFNKHRPSRYGVAAPFVLAPLASIDALSAATPDAARINALTDPRHACLYAYAPDHAHGPLAFRARMFAPGMGMPEDPATGSAAASLAGALMQFEPLGEGTHEIDIRQGVEMGRPSLIGLQLTIESGALAGVEIAGHAVRLAQGSLLL